MPQPSEPPESPEPSATLTPNPAGSRPDFLPGGGHVRAFLDHHFLHFNSRELVAAARGYEAHVDAGGKMMVTLAGAMSTARIGKTLARMIRQDKVHAITCTGANLEEDIFNLFAGDAYEHCPNWRALSAEDEKALYDRGLNRVTDTCIPETVMRQIEAPLRKAWTRAAKKDERYFPHEYMQQVLENDQLAEHYCRPPQESWLLAAFEKNIPVFTPGWEDSTLGNMFTACVIAGELSDHACMKLGTEVMQSLCGWYKKQTQHLCNDAESNSPANACGASAPPPPEAPETPELAEFPGVGGAVGFFQIGGGIAGDFPICAVPMMIQDLKWMDTPYWGYFCQISDAITSYGGYSGAVPNEKSPGANSKWAPPSS